MAANIKTYRKTINSWCMYDWANSAFVCTIAAAVYPPFFRSLATEAGYAPHQATAIWGYTAAVALLLVAVMAPVLGAISDYMGGKKKFVGFFAGLGILASAGMVFLGRDSWLWGSILFICGNLGFAGGNVFYESILPHVARKNDIDQVSTKGYALGYVGGGLLLIVNLCWIMKPAWFWMPDAVFAIKASFFSVALWWGFFSVPFFRNVPEPPAEAAKGTALRPVRTGFKRFAQTLKDITHYRDLMLFLIAFWFYNDGIGTIIKMATAYGSEIGINTNDMIIALIITQFVGIPFSFLFGSLAKVLTAKRCIYLSLGVYTLICMAGYFMETALHFYILAFMVGTVQGGSQALSRSLFGAMVPRHKSAQFFGFFSTSAKIAGIAGPFLFGFLSQVIGHSRFSIAALVVFFAVGGGLLTKVDVARGIRNARIEENAVGLEVENPI